MAKLTEAQRAALSEIVARPGQRGTALAAKGHAAGIIAALERLDLIVGDAGGLGGIVLYPSKAQQSWSPRNAGRHALGGEDE